MSSLESLPPDQQAVLTLVLKNGRSYDEIASMLSIDRAAVRDRALGALDALGPNTRLPALQRALITDYLLGQLPDRVKAQVRESLASSASERVWARVLAGELAPIAGKPLPEIPASHAAEPAAEPAAEQEPAAPAEAKPEPVSAATEQTSPARAGSDAPEHPAPHPASSRQGGTILLAAIAALIVVAVVIVVIAANSGSNTSTTGKKTSTTASTGTTTAGSTTTSKTPHLVAQINLHPPSASSKAAGIADVVTEGKLTALIVAADHMPPNTKHNAYAIWLFSPGGSSRLLGYVSPGVGKNGDLKTTGELPSDAPSFKEILITLETTTNTKTPGPIVLQGALSLNGG